MTEAGVEYERMAEQGRYSQPGPAAHSSADLVEFFNPTGLVLDLGCGSGRHSRYLEDCGLATVAFDISVTQLLSSGVRNRVRGDATRLPFQSAVFDCVLCSEVLEHLEHPEFCVSEIHRVLKTGGSACFTTPCLNIPLPFLVTLYRRLAGVDLEAHEHMQVFSGSRLARMLTPSFDQIRIRYTKFTAVVQNRFRLGYSLDRFLTRLSTRVPLLRFIAAAVFVRAVKTNQ